MQKSTLLQLAIGLTLSAVAGLLVFNWLGSQSKEHATPAPKQISLLVAAEPLSKGTRLTEQLLTTAPFLEASAPAGGFNEVEELLGRVVATPVDAGEPITRLRLVDPEAQFGKVSTLISPGKRAIAVQGNEVLGISGFILPGNHVDVLVTIDDERRKKDLSVTKTVLENIRVIATGTQIENNADDETASVDVYTLELTPREAEKLSLAATRGTLHFALRNPADKERITTAGTNVPDTLASLSPPKPVQKRRPTTKVEVISGTDRNTVRFRQ